MLHFRALAFPAVVAGAALVAAACGSGGGYGRSASTTTASAAASSAPGPVAPTTVAVTASALGQVIVDGAGRSLYLFEADPSNASTCYDACAEAWPPLVTTGAPDSGSNVSGADLTTVARHDGTVQVAYHGHPLYRFVGDKRVGDTNGEGLSAFGARWYVVGVNGAPTTPS